MIDRGHVLVETWSIETCSDNPLLKSENNLVLTRWVVACLYSSETLPIAARTIFAPSPARRPRSVADCSSTKSSVKLLSFLMAF